MTCTFQGCTNNKFAPNEECALHCVKSKYQDDRLKGVLSEFYDLLKVYIADLIDSKPLTSSPNLQSVLNSSPKSFILGSNINIGEKIREGDLNDEGLRDLIRKYNKSNEITISDIYFPYRDNRDIFDYFKLLKLFNGIHLINCHFYIGNWQFEDVDFFFQDCIFYNWFDITPIKMLGKATNCLFSECEFKDKVIVSGIETDNIFEDSLFSGCKFKKLLRLENTVFKKEPFLEEKGTTANIFISNLEISDCKFEEIFKLNNTTLASFLIENTNIISGFQLTKTSFNIFKCIDVTIEGVFNASESHFSYAKFERVKFYDVADFEKAEFGESDITVIASYPVTAIFKFVTFMTASNFKKVNFYYGLDFEDVDLREQPNFLKSKINPYNTNRETFRIIKNSFDSRGNTLEANRFFVQEMKAFKNELKEEGSFWDKLVYNVNDLISEFGANYIRPIIILLASIFLYTCIDYLHKDYFSSHDYFISVRLEPFWIFLNSLAKNFLPFSRFLASKDGIEFISLLFYIWFAVLIWQIIVAVKRHTQR